MSKLHAAMAFAHTAHAHPFTIADIEGGREYTWACPPGCDGGTDTDPCQMVRRIRDALTNDLLGDDLPAGEYLTVPTLWSVYLTHLDGSPIPEAVDAP